MENLYNSEYQSRVVSLENNENRCMARVLVEQEIKEFLELANNVQEGARGNTSILGQEVIQREQSIDIVNYFNSTHENRECLCDNGRNAASVEFTAPDDWQSELVTPTQRFTELFSMGHLSDITISFSESDEVIKAHKLVLASCSFVFERMLYTNTMEARTGKVKLCCDVEGFKWILNNLYRGKSELDDVVTALRVYAVAQIYQMNGISAMCKDYLRYQVSLDNVSDVFNAAKLFSEDSLMNACLAKLNASWPSMIENHISEMTVELWMYLLQRPVLPTPEVMLFKGLVCWAKYQLELEDGLSSPSNIRRKIEKFLPFVRLLSIPLDNFIDNVVPTQVFSPEECTGILMRLRGISSSTSSSQPGTLPCSPVLHGRIEMNTVDLKYVVLARMSSERRKSLPATVSDMVLVKNLTVSSPILVQQLQTQDNSTLKHAHMIVTDSDGKQVGVAKPLGPTWRFVAPVFIHANRPYQIKIDKVLVSKAFYRRDISQTSGGIKFEGHTGDNYIRLGFWPALTKA